MGLKFVRDGGKVRRWWYGQYLEKDKWKTIRLTTPMRGRIPSSLDERGDETFERSRIEAQKEFDLFTRERQQKGAAAYLTAALIEAKTGQAVEYVTVEGLEAAWRKLHPRARCSVQETAISWFFRLFADSVRGRRRFLYEVTVDDVSCFYAGIRGKYADSTVRRMMHLLKGAMADALPVGASNPFTRVEIVPQKGGETVHRRPLSEAELRLLFAEAAKDPLLNALTVTTACTGMRIGDVCNLKWASVDLAAGLVGVVTRKTGAEVFVPILAPFRAVLEGALATSEAGEAFVFPDAANLYARNYTRVIRMGKDLFARALFKEQAEREAGVADADAEKKRPAEVLAAIRSAKWTAGKREKAERVYTLYLTGLSYREIQKETGLGRGAISQFLHEVERLTGVTIVKWAKQCALSGEALRRLTRQERTVGKHSASLYGWHSLRASFVVSALNCGVPLEVVRRVVGHTTADMTLEYFNPTKRIAAEALRRRMEKTALGGAGGGTLGATIDAEAPSVASVASVPLLPTATPASAKNATGPDLAALRKLLDALTPEQRAAVLGGTNGNG